MKRTWIAMYAPYLVGLAIGYTQSWWALIPAAVIFSLYKSIDRWIRAEGKSEKL